jgi:hypothetical protein
MEFRVNFGTMEFETITHGRKFNRTITARLRGYRRLRDRFCHVVSLVLGAFGRCAYTIPVDKLLSLGWL